MERHCRGPGTKLQNERLFYRPCFYPSHGGHFGYLRNHLRPARISWQRGSNVGNLWQVPGPDCCVLWTKWQKRSFERLFNGGEVNVHYLDFTRVPPFTQLRSSWLCLNQLKGRSCRYKRRQVLICIFRFSAKTIPATFQSVMKKIKDIIHQQAFDPVIRTEPSRQFQLHVYIIPHQSICEFLVGFPLLWLKAYPGYSEVQ